MLMKLLTPVKYLINLIFPKLCVACGVPLVKHEEFLCLHCLLNLPKTNYHLNPNNPAAGRFADTASVKKVSSYLRYNKHGITQAIVKEIKYRNNRKLGRWIGQMMAKDMASSGFFDGIDLLLPVPLHSSRKRKRGFNQSLEIALGIQAVTSIPIDAKSVRRTGNNPTQTLKRWEERLENVTGIFTLVDGSALKNRRIVLIDDVMTSCATMKSLLGTILDAGTVETNVLTVALAG
ncbi:MAG: ComF family protein [Dysgonamonadaceae bacterium]|jgi:ComF family protein|nr:ComF family protein [Dysgonamonadaceae bacterium]